MITWTVVKDCAVLTLFALAASTVIVTALGGLVYLFFLPSKQNSARPPHPMSIPVLVLMGISAALTGIVSGYLTGASRTPAVDALIPAALTFIGGLSVFVSTKVTDRHIVALSQFAALCFVVSLMFGAGVGSTVRTKFEIQAASAIAGIAKADRDLQVMLYRQALGLPPEISAQGTDNP